MLLVNVLFCWIEFYNWTFNLERPHFLTCKQNPISVPGLLVSTHTLCWKMKQPHDIIKYKNNFIYKKNRPLSLSHKPPSPVIAVECSVCGWGWEFTVLTRAPPKATLQDFSTHLFSLSWPRIVWRSVEGSLKTGLRLHSIQGQPSFAETLRANV